jgi:hypothetical protein
MTGTLGAAKPWNPSIFAGPSKQVYNQVAFQARSVESRVIDRLDVIRQMPLFADMGQADLEALARDMLRRQFREGEAIFQQGDPGQMLYLVESGQVSSLTLLDTPGRLARKTLSPYFENRQRSPIPAKFFSPMNRIGWTLSRVVVSCTATTSNTNCAWSIASPSSSFHTTIS